jgi:hypothetical protein
MDFQSPLQSISKSPQPHKFFTRTLDNDLSKLSEELQDRYLKINEAKVFGVAPMSDNELWQSSNSVSTIKWREYNVFQFHIDGIRSLYDSLAEMTKEACEYYGIDFKAHKFMAQGWFNINEANNGKLDWHEHGSSGAPLFHGYYAVNAEPSETHYMTSQGPKTNVNKNNQAILSEMGHPHAMGDWSWSGPRITVAYDVLPLSHLQNEIGMTQEQHWVPLN